MVILAYTMVTSCLFVFYHGSIKVFFE